jgi:pimeloyl-ACP methyl ester carboxylesterase
VRKTTKTIIVVIPLVFILGIIGIYYLLPEVTFNLLKKIERNVAGFDQHSIEVSDLHIEYLEGGQGDVLILLHGFGANKDNWTRIGRYLTPHFRVIAPDLPGFGESTRDPEADYSIAAQSERLHAFARALKIKSFHLAGSSMGGAISGIYAARYPENVKSLWLIAPGGVASADPSQVRSMLDEGRPNPLIAESVEDYEQLLDFVFVKRPFIPPPIKRYLAQEAIDHYPLNRKIYKQIHSAADTPPLEVTLSGLTIPTLILWGASDRVLHVSGAGILKSVMPKAKLITMEGVGHLPMIEMPKDSAEFYLNFLGITDK